MSGKKPFYDWFSWKTQLSLRWWRGLHYFFKFKSTPGDKMTTQLACPPGTAAVQQCQFGLVLRDLMISAKGKPYCFLDAVHEDQFLKSMKRLLPSLAFKIALLNDNYLQDMEHKFLHCYKYRPCKTYSCNIPYQYIFSGYIEDTWSLYAQELLCFDFHCRKDTHGMTTMEHILWGKEKTTTTMKRFVEIHSK